MLQLAQESSLGKSVLLVWMERNPKPGLGFRGLGTHKIYPIRQ